MNTTETEPYVTADPRRWLALVVIAVAQLMVVLDASIVNIALPSAQRSLHITDANRQWVVTAYALAFGGLLLLGGRIADFIGRKSALSSLAWSASGVASAIGGIAQNQGELFGARGSAGCLRSPHGPCRPVADHCHLHRAARAGTGVRRLRRHLRRRRGTRPHPRRRPDRIRLLALDLLVNTPIAIVHRPRGHLRGPESRAEGKPHYDIPGVITSTLGLVALVYGFTKANESGWSATSTIVPCWSRPSSC